MLATKTHQTPAALEQLTRVAPPGVPVLCLQNGVANERMALRLFPNVHGVVVLLPAVHVDPGVVVVNSSGTTGILDIGRARRHRRGRRPGGGRPLRRVVLVPAGRRRAGRGSGPSSCATSATPSRRPAPIRTARRRKSWPIQARAEGEACFAAAGWRFDRRRRVRGPQAQGAGAVASGRRGAPGRAARRAEPAAPRGAPRWTT